MAARRSTRTKRAEPAPQAEVLEEVDTGGMGIDEGIVITTTLLLIGALIVVYMALQAYTSPAG